MNTFNSSAPAEELRAAATRLRVLADRATPGPWAADHSVPYGHRVGGSDEADWVAWTGEHGESGSEADAAYIAAMHPVIALALANWLNETARNTEPFGRANAHAVEVARQILGTSPTR